MLARTSAGVEAYALLFEVSRLQPVPGIDAALGGPPCRVSFFIGDRTLRMLASPFLYVPLMALLHAKAPALLELHLTYEDGILDDCDSLIVDARPYSPIAARRNEVPNG